MLPLQAFLNWSRGLGNTSQKPNFQLDHALPRSCYINEKVGAKGLEWCYMGENWRKLAEIAGNWRKGAKIGKK